MKYLLPFIILNLSFIIPSQGQVIFHENFEFPDSVISASGFWNQNQRIQTSGLSCDSSSYSVGGSDTLTTIAFSTVGYSGVFLSFNQICKIEFFDEGFIEVSPDSGLTWIQLCYQLYMGGALLQFQSCRFSEASYATWDPGTNGVPDNSWWKAEAFDLTGILFNCSNAMVRFVLRDQNNNGMVGRAGWFLDDLIISDDGAHAFVRGMVYLDSNANAVKDAGEPGLPNRLVADTLDGRVTVTSGSGEYYFAYSDTVNSFYEISVSPLNCYTISPAWHTGSITAIGQIDSLRDFALQYAAACNDVGVYVTRLGWFRSGMNASYSLIYSNHGTTTQSPTIVFYLDNDLTFVGSSLTPNAVAADSVVWNVGPLLPLQTGQFTITVHIAPFLPLGTLINSGAVIEPIAGDTNTQNNQSWVEIFTTGSYDPNDISVSEDTLYTYELITPPSLEYVIRFQNTGNDTAFHVQILNEIPAELDFSTFELVGSSHPVELDYHSNLRLMIFDFESILLPDSNVDEPASHGFISYRMKPLTNLAAGDSIESSAAIYFDYNDPVLTNSAVTEIVLPTGTVAVPGATPVAARVFPNPSGGEFNLVIDGMKNEQVEVELYDVMGKSMEVLYDGYCTSDRFHLMRNIAELANGIYMVSVRSVKMTSQVRWVKY